VNLCFRFIACLLFLRRVAAAAPTETTSAPPAAHPATIESMAETDVSLQEQLDEIGVQLAWVRDYL
jgi:hypothetical protein